ncbi:MAG: reductive dehalogenase [Desulfobacula sp.]|jgi:epoxyqueuosine reductase|nr:reductive dehalogenase [Desulfobacula sp.]
MRSVNFVEKGAGRHVVGKLEPYDQKNEMFKRPHWDPTMQGLRERLHFIQPKPGKNPGYQLTDMSATNAAWRLEMEYARGIRGGRTGFYAWDWDGNFNYPRIAPGQKITTDEAEIITPKVKKAASLFGASLVGICELDRRWLYSHAYLITPEGGKVSSNIVPDEFKYAVVIAVEMNYEAIMCSPSGPASTATGLGYSKMAFTAGLLAQYIRGLGYQALPCGNDTACSIPIAIDAGLGEIARNGLLITPEYGPRVRLAKVFTDLPLTSDRPIEFGVKEFCMVCEKCAKKCPSKSIMYGKPKDEPHNISNRKGVDTWHINAETCMDFWAHNKTDCSNCIRVCPFNKPPGKLHNMVRWGINNIRQFDRAFLWGDDMMGYGKRKNVKYFWK